jgi:hypothetical protein
MRRGSRSRNIFSGGEMRDEITLLIDNPDTQGLRVTETAKLAWCAIQQNVTGIPLDGAADDFQQRGFTGAIYPEHPMHFAGLELDIHLCERHHVCRGFVDAAQ